MKTREEKMQEIRFVLRLMKNAIKDANNLARFSRVQHLKSQKVKLKDRLLELKNNN